MNTPKTQIVSVLFLDIIGYSKRAVSDQVEIKRAFNALLAHALEPVAVADRIVLDTGDGAAVAFLQHPEDALLVSDRLMAALFGEDSKKDGALFGLRSGIHFGPAVIVHDVNGFGNLVGDGINDAQRIMNFAGDNEVFASRHYAEMVARISNKFADRFVSAGSMKDKHGKAHDVSRVLPSGYALPARVSPPDGAGAMATALPRFVPFRTRPRLFPWVAAFTAVLVGMAGWWGVRPVPPMPTTASSAAARLSPEAAVADNAPAAEPPRPAITAQPPSPPPVAAHSQPAPVSQVKRAEPARKGAPISSSEIVPATSALSKEDTPCPQCNCSDLLTKTSLGVTLTATESLFLQRQCR